MRRCAVCEAPEFAVIELDIRIAPVWSLIEEDQGQQWASLALCRECVQRLSAGDDLSTEMYVTFAPGALAKATA